MPVLLRFRIDGEGAWLVDKVLRRDAILKPVGMLKHTSGLKKTKRAFPFVAAALLPLMLAGCNGIKPKILTHYVYVTAKTTFLRDRIAAVSNRTGNVVNGQRLEILEQNRRFYKVKTDDGAVGWIDERAVATEKVSKEFEDLQKDHLNESPVATGSVRDDVYMHSAPGRDTDRLYRLDEGEKLKLLERASTVKPLPPGTPPATATVPLGKNGKPDPTAAPVPPPPPAMEDWWLVRDSHGHTGWMLSRMLDTDAPESIARYAEGQRIVGAYVINTVTDPTVEGASQDVPQYVVVTSPYQAGLPYDFNQIRVFSWNLKRHRYETANRDKNILGYLPVKIGRDPGSPAHDRIPASGPAPSYAYTVLAAGAPVPQVDPATGRYLPAKGQLVTKTYRLEGNVTRRVLAPGASAPAEARLEPVEEKKTKKRR
jgi:SH3-like domain-containing protein